jgi:hypothetical protein
VELVLVVSNGVWLLALPANARPGSNFFTAVINECS